MSLASPTAEEIIARLLLHAEVLRRAGIRHLSLFGSIARGEAGPDSDVDLAAELDPNGRFSLIDLVRVENELADLLGRKVDLVTEPAKRPSLRANLERDRRRVF